MPALRRGRVVAARGHHAAVACFLQAREPAAELGALDLLQVEALALGAHRVEARERLPVLAVDYLARRHELVEVLSVRHVPGASLVPVLGAALLEYLVGVGLGYLRPALEDEERAERH